MATRTFKTALRSIRQTQKISLMELGLRINSDASHIFKIEHGQDVTLFTMLKLAAALDTTLQLGPYVIVPEQRVTKKRLRQKSK